MKMWNLFPREEFIKAREEGLIRVQILPESVLAIANYTQKAVVSHTWNDVTMNCRGLIFDIFDNEIISRGFPKFFNWDQSGQPYPPQSQCELMPKMDGSLGISYPYDGKWHIATRGAFQSDQAIKATEMFQQGIEDYGLDPQLHLSYLFEIIYPENRIVVNYGEDERLVLLDVLNTETGKSDLNEFHQFDWPDKVPRKWVTFSDQFVHEIPQGEEGFVFHWPYQGLRVKMKSADYLELHRMIFGLNSRMVWQRLGQGETWQEICEKLPDEFHEWVKQIATGLEHEASYVKVHALRDYADFISGVNHIVDDKEHRKEFAKLIAGMPNKSFLFMLYDGKDITEAVWNTLKPSGADGIKVISEDVA